MSVAHGTMIRLATDKDCERLCELSSQYHRVLKENHPNMTADDQLLGREKEFFLKALQKENEVIFLEEENGAVNGYIYAILWKTRADDLVSVPHIEIVFLLVDNGHSGKGIGRALMERVHQWGLEKGIRVFHLAVHEFNRKAQRFYEKLGYSTIMRLMERTLG